MARPKKKDKDTEVGAESGSGDIALIEAPSPAVSTDDHTIYSGEVLKKIRESQNLTLRQLSDRTKISVGILGALEEERFDEVPNARVYVRGFVRSLARELALDLDQVSKTYVPRWEKWVGGRSSA